MIKAIHILNQPNASPTRATRKYTQYHLKGVLMFMGTKQNHAEEIAALVFNNLAQLHPDVDRYSMDYDSFLRLMRKLLEQFNYSNPMQDIEVAWRIKDKQKSVCILLGGTSGCGKSTLASLLAHRIGITTVLSTDNVRHLLRNFHPIESAPVLWASSYHAGESLVSPPTGPEAGPADHPVVAGFEAQNEIIFEKLKEIIRTFEKRRECLIVEGVHLSIKHILRLVREHSNCIPFLIYISNQTKHTERFAIRAKYMTLEPRINKYVKYFENIRIIQDYLCTEADKWLVPKVDNTNVDRSLAILHTTVVNVLSRLETTGRPSVIDPDTGKLDLLNSEYTRVHESSWSSKQMLRKIRQNNNPHRKRTVPPTTPSASGSNGSPSASLRPTSSTLNSSRGLHSGEGGYYSAMGVDPANELAYMDDAAWGSLAS